MLAARVNAFKPVSTARSVRVNAFKPVSTQSLVAAVTAGSLLLVSDIFQTASCDAAHVMQQPHIVFQLPEQAFETNPMGLAALAVLTAVLQEVDLYSTHFCLHHVSPLTSAITCRPDHLLQACLRASRVLRAPTLPTWRPSLMH